MKSTTTQILYAVLAMCALTACEGSAVISDLETDKVVVQSSIGTDDAAIVAEARYGCALHGRVPVAISSGCVQDSDCLLREHLFACVER